MSLVEDGKQVIADLDHGQTPSQPWWDPTLPDITLSPVASADLLLGLAGVLPDGHLLGGPVTAPHAPTNGPGAPTGAVSGAADGTTAGAVNGTSGAAARSVAVFVESPSVLEQALRLDGIVLRDEEQTPLAVLESVSADDGAPSVLRGLPRGLRSRESGAWARRTIDFDDQALHRLPVLFLARPATEADVSELRAWLRGVDVVLVLVPEHAADGNRVPTGTLLQLADDLTAELGTRSAPVFTVPLEEHDEASITAMAALIVSRLDAVDSRQLTDSLPATTAPLWVAARDELVAGRTGTGSTACLPAGTRAALRAWRPPRHERGLGLMFTGLSGSGKSTLARDVADWLTSHTSRRVTLLDGDIVRRLLSSGLGFDRASREVNVRRIGYVASEVVRHGGVAICSPIAPFADTRQEVRRMVEPLGDFILIHVSTPLEECERRDLKGLYAQARAGQVQEFTGISSPYEVPSDADLRIDTAMTTRDEAAQQVVDLLRTGGWLGDVR